MSHHTSLSVKYPGRSLNFPLAQSSSELSFGKASSDAGERAIFLHSPSMKSLLLTSATTPYQSALLVTQDILGRIVHQVSSSKKKINILDQYPHPHPSLHVERLADLYTPRVTKLLKLRMLLHIHFSYDFSEIFTQVSTHIQLHFKYKKT